MSRFFKSAAFPIIIVVVLAFFAQRLILDNSSSTPSPTWNQLVADVNANKVRYFKRDESSNTVKYTTDPDTKKDVVEVAIPAPGALDDVTIPLVSGGTANVAGTSTGGSPWWS